MGYIPTKIEIANLSVISMVTYPKPGGQENVLKLELWNISRGIIISVYHLRAHHPL